MGLRRGDRKSIDQSDCLKLVDLGIRYNQSTRWQLEATLAEGIGAIDFAVDGYELPATAWHKSICCAEVNITSALCCLPGWHL
jgi:hypothetical protein